MGNIDVENLFHLGLFPQEIETRALLVCKRPNNGICMPAPDTVSAINPGSHTHRALAPDGSRPPPVAPADTEHSPSTGEGHVGFDKQREYRTPAVAQTLFVDRHQVLAFECQGACTDWDETGAKGTAKGVHDTAQARFSYGCTMYIQFLEGKHGISILREEHRTYIENDPESNGCTIFNEDRWAEYVFALGNSEPEVVDKLAGQLEADFQLTNHGITVDRVRLGEFCRTAFLKNSAYMCRDVHLDADLFATLDYMAGPEHNIPISVVSASHTDIVVEIAALKNGHGPFKAIIGGATKKTTRPSFEGEDLRKAFIAMGIDPETGTMFGDGRPDIGCSILAGCPMTIICDPELMDKEDWEDRAKVMVAKVCEIILKNHPNDGEIHRRVREHKVYFCRDFSSLRFAGRPVGDSPARAEIFRKDEYDRLPQEAEHGSPA